MHSRTYAVELRYERFSGALQVSETSRSRTRPNFVPCTRPTSSKFARASWGAWGDMTRLNLGRDANSHRRLIPETAGNQRQAAPGIRAGARRGAGAVARQLQSGRPGCVGDADAHGAAAQAGGDPQQPGRLYATLSRRVSLRQSSEDGRGHAHHLRYTAELLAPAERGVPVALGAQFGTASGEYGLFICATVQNRDKHKGIVILISILVPER